MCAADYLESATPGQALILEACVGSLVSFVTSATINIRAAAPSRKELARTSVCTARAPRRKPLREKIVALSVPVLPLHQSRCGAPDNRPGGADPSESRSFGFAASADTTRSMQEGLRISIVHTFTNSMIMAILYRSPWQAMQVEEFSTARGAALNPVREG